MDVETQLALHGDHTGDEPYVPYVSLDPLNDPKSFTFRIKVQIEQKALPTSNGTREVCDSRVCFDS